MSGTILLSSNRAWNLVNFRRPIIQALVARGYAVAAAAPADPVYEERLAALGCSFHPVPMDAKGISPAGDLVLTARYAALMRRLRPRAYLSWTIKPTVYGALAARLAGVPPIPNISGLGTAFMQENALTKVVTQLYRTALGHAPTVFFQNQDDRALFLARRMVRTEQARLLAGSGVDVAHFAPPADPARPRGRFLMVARLLGDKGAREFVAAARALRRTDPTLRFAILGAHGAANRTAIPHAEIASWEREGVVELLGEADDVRAEIARSECVVLPSYREGLPRVLLEGSAMARPLVATDVPGCRDVVVEGETGFLCTVRDAGSLAAAMRRVALLDDPAWHAMGAAGRRRVTAHFSERAVVEAYLAALADAGVS